MPMLKTLKANDIVVRKPGTRVTGLWAIGELGVVQSQCWVDGVAVVGPLPNTTDSLLLAHVMEYDVEHLGEVAE